MKWATWRERRTLHSPPVHLWMWELRPFMQSTQANLMARAIIATRRDTRNCSAGYPVVACMAREDLVRARAIKVERILPSLNQSRSQQDNIQVVRKVAKDRVKVRGRVINVT